MKDYDVILYVCTRAQVNICVWLSETEQMLYSGGEVSSGADEDLQVCFSVSEAHWAQMLQLVLELRLVNMDLRSYLKSYSLHNINKYNNC